MYPADYMGKLVDYCMVKIYSLIKVKETGQTWSEEDDFVLEKPKLNIEVTTSSVSLRDNTINASLLSVQVSDGGRLQRGRPGRVRLWFRNPLEVPLSRCKVTVETAGLSPVKEAVPDVEPGATFTHTALVTPTKAGRGVTLLASFGSEEMIDVHGSVKVDVME